MLASYCVISKVETCSMKKMYKTSLALWLGYNNCRAIKANFKYANAAAIREDFD